jgi:pyrrolidone-carboxylate peptidase
MARVLLTGVEPFGGARVNPAQDIVRALDGWAPTGQQPIDCAVIDLLNEHSFAHSG